MHRPNARLALAALLAVLALLGLAPPLTAAREPKIPESMLAIEAGCGPGDEGRLIAIVDASAADDCDQTPEAVAANYVTARCICNHGTLEAVAEAADLSGYAELAGADFTGPVSVTDATTSFVVSDGLAEFQVSDGIENFIVLDMDANVGFFGLTGFFGGESGSVRIQGCSAYGARADYSGIATPAECDTFYDTTIHAPCHYNGTAWKSMLDGTTDCTSGS